MTLLPFLRPQPFLQRTLPTTLYRSIRMSSNIATLVADARKTLPSASKDSAAIDAWVEKISSGEEGKDLQALDKKIEPVVYLFNNELSIADVATFGALHPILATKTKEEYYTTPSLVRYVSHLQSLPNLSSTLSSYPPIEFNLTDMIKVERKSAVAKEKKPKKPTAAAEGEKKVEEVKEEAKGLVAGVTEQLGNLSVAATNAASSLASTVVDGAQQAAAAVGLGGEGQQKTQKKEKKAKAPKPAAAVVEPTGPSPSMIDLRVGHILSVAKHPDADSLYVEQVDVGEAEPRTIVSGLVNYMTLEQMQGARIVVVANMKPVAMRGIKSFAMVLCASSAEGKEGGIEFVQPPAASKPGERIYFEGAKFENATPLEVLNPKKKIFEAVQPGFTTLPSLEAAWVDKESGEVAKIRTKDGYCTVKSFVGASLS